jgi:hypothetical protein
MLRIAFTLVVSAHALVHLLGFAKALDLAPLAQLRIPISRLMGWIWLAAAVGLLVTVTTLFVAPRWFWVAGAVSLVASQTAIVASWSDARFGSVANAVVLTAVIYGAFAWGPFGLRADYERLVREGVARSASAAPATPIDETDLATVPAAVQRYLRFVGVVGTSRPAGFRARMTGRIRGSAAAPWMPFVAEQVNLYDPPRRYFRLEANRGGLPVDGLHAYGEAGASMRIRALSLFPVVDLDGSNLTRTETVTILNDMSIFAPARLLDPGIHWREVDPQRVEATYTVGAHTIRAILVFDADGALVDFLSDDRPALAEDGKTMLPQKWSTPVREYRAMGPYRLATRGEGRYAAPEGEYAYLEIDVQEVKALPMGQEGAR